MMGIDLVLIIDSLPSAGLAGVALFAGIGCILLTVVSYLASLKIIEKKQY